MNREVEERIVAMYLDNRDFEKNAKSTIDTLGQLKESLNIDENVTKGFSVFEKISKSLNFDKANQKLQTMRGRLDSMRGSVGKIFEMSQTTLGNAENAVYSFRNTVSRVFGFDLASKIVGNVESAFRSLTIAPINAGWDQYQQKMDSVKTIMSSTGASIETVDKQLQSMTEYANKTIYSLTDMTSNLGKFTNNGIELERATKAMEGIANATADAGQGAQQASMAMYNISQAMGVGKMTTIDWKSLENANIATQKLKTTFLEMAAASGRLKKEVKDVAGKKVTSYFLDTDEEGKKLKQKIELTAANFREYLSKGWLDKETMLRTFEIYSGAGIDVDTLEAWGITDKELQKELLDLGRDALESAQQVRTFTKMMDALKESVQSGWAGTFEIIFGNMEEGTTLWTRLSEEIDAILTKSTENRNKILKDWSETREELGTEHVTKQYVDTSTWQRDLEAKEQRIAELKAQLDADQNRLTQTERQQAKKDISTYDREINQKEARIKKINDQLAKGDQTLTHGEKENLRKEKEQLQKEIDAGKRRKTELSQKLANDETSKLSAKERDRIERELEEYQAEIDHLEELIRNAEKLTYETDETVYGRSGREIAIDTLFQLIDIFKQVGQAISEAFNDVFGSLTGDQLFDLTKKIEEKVKGIAEWFGKLDDESSRISKIKKGLTGVFSVIKAGISIISRVWGVVKRIAAPVLDVLVDAFAKVGAFLDGFGDLSPVEMINKIGDGVQKLWEKIRGFFTAADGEKDSPFAKWAKNAWAGFKRVIKDWTAKLGLGDLLDKIKEAWDSVVDWFEQSGIGTFLSDIWGWMKDKFNIVVGFFKEPEENGATGFQNFITGVWNNIDTAWQSLIKWFEESGIKDFLSNAWEWIKDKFNITVGFFTAPEENGATGFVNFVTGIWNSINEAWTSIKAWFNDSGIREFINNSWEWLKDEFGIVLGFFTEPQENGATGFSNFITDIWDSINTAWQSLIKWFEESGIKDFLSNAWEWIKDKFNIVGGFFTAPQENGATGFVNFITGIWSSIESAWTSIEAWFNESGIKEFLSNAWEWMKNTFNMVAQKFTIPDENGVTGFQKFLTDAEKTIREAWNTVVNFFQTSGIKEFFSDIWGWITDILGISDKEEKAEGRSSGKFGLRTRAAAVTNGMTQLVSDVGSGAKKISEGDVKDAEKSVSFFERIFNALTGFFNSVKEATANIAGMPELTRFIEAMGSFLTGFMNILSTVLESLGRVMKGQGTAEDKTGLIIGGVIAAVMQIFDFINTSHLAKITTAGQSVSSKFLAIAGGLFLLAAGVALLTTIDQGKMWSAVGAVAVLGLVLGAIISLFNDLKATTNAGRIPLTGGQQIVNNLVDQIGKIGMIAVAMAMLPSIIETIAKVKKDLGNVDIGKDIMDSLLGVAALIATVGLVFTVIQKITGNTGLNPVATVKSAFSLVAGIAIVITGFEAVLGLIGGISDLLGGESNQKKVIELINNGAEILSAIGGAIGGFVYALVNGGTDLQKTNDANAQMAALADMAQTFNSDQVSGISRMMALMSDLSSKSSTVDTGKLKDFGEAMRNVAVGVNEFVRYLAIEGSGAALEQVADANSDTYKRLWGFVAFGKALGEMLSVWGDIHLDQALDRISTISEEENLSSFVQNVNKIIAGLGDLNQPETGIQFDGLAIVTKLYEAIQQGLLDPKLPKFDATSIIDDILEAIGLGTGAISMAVHEMVQNGLEASGKDGNGNGYNTSEGGLDLLNNLLNTDGSFKTIDLSGITNQLFGADGTGGIIGEFNTLADKIPSMDSMFADKGWMDFKDENGNEIDLLGVMQEHLTELGTQLSTMEPLKVTITPVFDWTNMTPEAIQTELDNRPMPLGVGVNNETMTISFEGLRSELRMDEVIMQLMLLRNATGFWGQLQKNSIEALGGHMDGISDTIAKLRVILDSGALVGELTPLIDEKLYQSYLVAGYTGGK